MGKALAACLATPPALGAVIPWLVPFQGPCFPIVPRPLDVGVACKGVAGGCCVVYC